jgi:hypothetical protein
MRSRDLKTVEVALPPLLAGLLRFCETECVAACCGLEAFDFTEERLREGLTGWSLPERTQVAEQLETIVRELEGRPGEMAASEELNAVWPKAKAIAFFSELLKTLKGAS